MGKCYLPYSLPRSHRTLQQLGGLECIDELASCASHWLQARCQTKKWLIHPSQEDSQLGNLRGIPSWETAIWDMVYPSQGGNALC